MIIERVGGTHKMNSTTNSGRHNEKGGILVGGVVFPDCFFVLLIVLIAIDSFNRKVRRNENVKICIILIALIQSTLFIEIFSCFDSGFDELLEGPWVWTLKK